MRGVGSPRRRGRHRRFHWCSSSHSPRHAVRVLLLCGFAACAAACAGPPTPGCPVALVPVAELAGAPVMRARVQLRFADQRVGFEVVSALQDGALVVLGVSRYGVRWFAVRQRGRDFEVEAASSELAHLARWTLDLLHRVYWIRPPAGADGEPSSSWSWGGESVSETRGDGGARQRRFERDGARRAASSAIVIDYPARAGGAAGPAVTIRNPSCGYEAQILELPTP